jgi:enterochelin esterase-like enzyme
MDQLLDTGLLDGPFPVGVYLAAAVVVLALVLGRTRRRRAPVLVLSVACGGLFGWVLTWLVSDVWDLFGVSVSTVTRLWVTAFFAALALAVSSLVGGRRWRKAVAILAVPVFLLAAGVGINVDFGEFPTVRAALGIAGYGSLPTALAAPVGSLRGTVGTVTIPPTASGFAARPAMVYLPPAARRAHPPVLPVVEMLSGQPGSPENVFTAGHLAEIFDAYAAVHAGLAPIVVVPDQLGAPEKNPLCIDSALGNSATYLTVDVPAWIRAHFRVAAAPRGWVIAGFSQGGTCSIQLGSAHPEVFGTILDISGELVPRTGSPAHTVQVGFGGSRAAYAAATPRAILAAHAPYAALRAIFAVGGNDARYLPWARTLAAAAARAGVSTRLIVSPGTAHDWHTVIFAWRRALPVIAAATGLGAGS